MYFSNSSDGMYFEEHNCFDCLNYRGTEQKNALIDCEREDNEGGFGCPIMDLHLIYQEKSDKICKEMLDYLLPSFECPMRLTYEDIKNKENDYIKSLLFKIGQLENGFKQESLIKE